MSAVRTHDRPIWVINVISLAVAVLVAFTLPVVYFLLSYQNHAGAMESEAEINSRIVGEVIKANPEMWKFEEIRLTELLSRRPSKGFPESRFLYDTGEKLIAKHEQKLESPTFKVSDNIIDSGNVVGRIEIHRSLRPVVDVTILVALVSLFLGGAVFVTLRIIPLRALRRALDALSREKERAQVTLHSIGDGVITTSLSGEVESINGMAEALTGWKAKDAIGRPVEEVFRTVDGKTRKRCRNPVESAISGASVGREREPGHRIVLVSRDGVDRLIEESVSLILENGETCAGAVLVFRDVTEKVRREEELLKGKKLESLGILAGGIAHDFNNFLSGIIGNISLAKLSVNPEEKAWARLEGAEKASLRAKELATRLLSFSRGGKPVRKPVSLAGIVRESSEFAVMGSNGRCEFSLPEGLWTVIGDEGQIGQVFGNLVLNAIQAMGGGGIVRVGAENVPVGEGEIHYVKAGDYVRIDVSDRGCGIPKENLQRIFDPYFTTKEKGSGLGLATTYNIMKSHGGNIFVESSPGAGTTFRLYFPAARDVPITDLKAEGKAVVRGKGRVLVMDDEDLILDVAGGMLEHLGYEATFAKEGAEAIEKYMREAGFGKSYDAVIMDLTIPGGMGGKEAVARLLEIHPDAKVIVSSGYSNDPVMANFGKFGFRGIVSKPYRIEELSRILHEVVTQGKGSPAAAS